MILKSLISSFVVPALIAKTINLEQHPDHIFKIETIKYTSGKDKKTGWFLFEDFQIDSNGLKETHDVKDDYYKIDPNKTEHIDREWLFYKGQDCSIKLNLYDWQSEEYGEPKLDCDVNKGGQVEVKLGEQTYEIEYSVKEMPKFEKYYQLMYLWDLATPDDKDGDDLYLRQKIDFHNVTYKWRLPRDDYFEYESSSFVSFKNFYLPCIEDHDVEIQLDRDDLISDEHSNFQKIDCQTSDFYVGHNFQISDGNHGKYRVMGKMISQGQINKGKIEVHHPDSVESNKIKKFLPANKAIQLNNIVNPFHRNDDSEDEINVAIYSDVYDQQFKCGRFEMRGSDAIDFKGLVVPCREMIAISLQEVDTTYDDGKTMIIPCTAQNQEFDLFLHDQREKNVRTSVKNLNLYSQEINSFSPFVREYPITNFASSLVGKNMGSEAGMFDESDAFYTVSLSGVSSLENIYLDPRLQNMDGQCGANLVNFHDKPEEPQIRSQLAPRLVSLNSLFNQFWTKSQKISMKIYSDYLDSIVGGDYDFENGHTYYNFKDVNIPCKNQIMIKLLDDDGYKHHTIAVNCQNEGKQKLSFKLGSFVIDASSEEFTDHEDLRESYSLEKDGEEIYTSNRPSKFVVKSVDILDEESTSKSIYILDINVIESSNEHQIYSEGLKNPVKVSGHSKPKLLEKRFNQVQDQGFFQLDAIKSEDEKVEIYVHSDLDKKNKFIKVFSKNFTFDEKIPCKSAMILVKTSKSQQMKLIECTQNGDFPDKISHVYKKTFFKPNLLTKLDKIQIAQDNENLKDVILRSMTHMPVQDIEKYLRENGSFQRSMVQEMGNQDFDDQLIKRVDGLDGITVSYIVNAQSASPKNLSLFVMRNEQSYGIFFMVGIVFVGFGYMIMNKMKRSTKTVENVTEMKESLIVLS